MTWYYYIAWVLFLAQLVFMYQMLRNFRYALKKYKKERKSYHPRTILIVPCKGKDLNFEENTASFFHLDYRDYLLWFVVEDTSDPAYNTLCKLKEKFRQTSKAGDVQILVAGKVTTQDNLQENSQSTSYFRSQKIHNLLYCFQKIPQGVEIMAFADSDICVPANWLSHLVYPLRKSKYGASTGYRWFIPQKNNLATLALTSINAKIAQLLGDSIFNQAWGGSMAIRVNTFRELGLDKIWQNALSDDLSLTVAVKKAHKKIVFIPACLVASHENTTFRQLFEFGKRQFLITRIYAPAMWWFGLASSMYSVLGLWGTAAMAFYTATIHDTHHVFFIALSVFFFLSYLTRAILRQEMAAIVLRSQCDKMKVAMIADMLFFWAWSFLLLFFIIASAFGRTITWRGIRYKLLSSTQTVTIGN